jgi:myo-inositol-1(or 4)-monophosphatase
MKPPNTNSLNADMTHRLEFTVEVALGAGRILRDGYDQQKTISLKGRRDLLTEFDLRSEEFIVRRIQERYPTDGILAEEGGEISGEGGRWVIDPLDGTTNFAHGIPFFVVSIAYTVGTETLLGVILDPMRDECFRATRGNGVWLEHHHLHVSPTKSVENSILATGFPHDIEHNPNNNLTRYSLASMQARAVRRLGSAALHLAYVAAGRLDGYWEMDLHHWDWAAGILMVQEAGGRVSRVDSGENIYKKPTSLLASNNFIHQEIQQIFTSGKQ